MTDRSIAATLLAATAAALLAIGCSPAPSALADTPGGAGAAAAGATALTQQANAAVAQAYDLADREAFEDAHRGLIARPSGQVRDAEGRVVWDFDTFAFIDGPAPATVNPSLWRQARLNNEVGLFKVADGLWQLRGFDISNITLIEGRSGWIVVDTLTSRETAAFAMAFARKHLGDKPVSAIVITHSHADHFGGALGIVSAEDAKARKLPVVAPAGFMEEATSENVMVGVAMSRRAAYTYGNLLPRSAQGLVDAGLGKALTYGRIGILAPTQLVSTTPQAMELDGVRFEFQNVPGSEAPAELTFYLPGQKAYCGAEMVSHTMHNLYTLRGAKVRDALKWSRYIDDAMRAAPEAEVYFGSHHWPVWGRERIGAFLARQRDVYRYIHDQSVRLMNNGYTMNEVAEQLKLPPSLDRFLDVHGYYGTVRHNAKAVVQFYLGWYDGNPAHLDPLPPREAAQRYVALAGGADKAVAAAQQAFDRGEYRWAAELLNHVVFAEPGHTAGRALLARTYDQLGYASESALWRNSYLSGALELRNGKQKEPMRTEALLDMLQHTPTERFLEAMAATLDGPGAADTRLGINLVLSDLGQTWALRVDNGVLHYAAGTPAADADATLTVTHALFLRMMTGRAGAKDLLLGDDAHVEGSRVNLLRFFALFGKAPGNFAIVEPK